ncbi:MAG: LLM class F420-dependent oxidoreductase [Chloroflexi bacterium]|nr:LLM class F420-dependent oxidoreductase [Chloroflexota bacterium]
MAPLFGLHMPNFSHHDLPPDQLFDRVVAQAQAAEAAGFDLLTVMDHFYQIGVVGPETEPMLEAYAVLAALAQATSRISLGTLVTGVTYRNPALLVKTVTTLDIISKGRAILGIGAAWNESEHTGYGFTFPPVRERMDRLGEALTIAQLMFADTRPSFTGRYYSIDRALNEPRPLQQGGPKILVGGAGEQRTLRLAARHADLTHWFVPTPEEFTRKNAILEEHCRAVGRDPSAIVRTIGAPVWLVRDEQEGRAVVDRLPPARRAMVRPATPEQAAEILHGFMRVGAQGFTFNNPNLSTPELIAAAGQVKQHLS